MKRASTALGTGFLSLCALLFAFALSRSVHAQDDTQIWLTAGASYRLDADIDVAFRQHLRFGQDISEVSEVLPQLALRYRVQKWLRLALAYRLVVDRDGREEFRIGHRGHFDVRLRDKWGDFRPHYRFRFQHRWRPRRSGDWNELATVRNRVGLSWRAGAGLRPYVSTENSVRIAEEDDGTRVWKQRFTLGTAYVLEQHTLKLFYRLEAFFPDERLGMTHIIGAGYDLSL